MLNSPNLSNSQNRQKRIHLNTIKGSTHPPISLVISIIYLPRVRDRNKGITPRSKNYRKCLEDQRCKATIKFK